MGEVIHKLLFFTSIPIVMLLIDVLIFGFSAASNEESLGLMRWFSMAGYFSIMFGVIAFSCWENKISIKTVIEENRVLIIVLTIIFSYAHLSLTNEMQIFLNDKYVANQIGKTVVKSAAGMSEPREYAEKTVNNAFVEAGRNPLQYSVKAELPEGYQFQKPLVLNIKIPVNGYFLKMLMKTNEITLSYTEPLNSSDVLRTTLN